MTILKVATNSNPNSVAGALVASLNESPTKNVKIQTIGAGALNQTIKAVAIARGFVAPSGRDLICIPSFADIDVNGKERTGINLVVEYRQD